MTLGEDLHVIGSVSSRLAYNLAEYQHLLSLRLGAPLKKVRISFEDVSSEQNSVGKVGTLFSGGLDALFTLHEHQRQTQPNPDYCVSHAIYINGFDILHDHMPVYSQLFSQFHKSLDLMGVELIPMQTNIFSMIHGRLDFSKAYGPMIVSCGLALGGLFSKFLVPSSGDYALLKKAAFTSDPLMDSFLSTNATRIIHHGSRFTRPEKLEAIADWDIAREVMRVCISDSFYETGQNCCWCEKCVRTMMPLYAFGKLKDFGTFKDPLKRPMDFLRYARKYNFKFDYTSEIVQAVRANNPGLLFWLQIAIMLGTIRAVIINAIPGFLKNWLNRFGYFMTRNQQINPYEVDEISELIEKRDKQKQ